MTIACFLKKSIPKVFIKFIKKIIRDKDSSAQAQNILVEKTNIALPKKKEEEEAQSKKREMEIDDLVRSGFTHLFNNQLTESLEKIEQALVANPHHALARSAMARLCRNWNKNDEALKHAIFVSEKNPTDYFNREILGFILRDLGRFEESLSVLNTIEHLPNDPLKTLSLQLTTQILKAIVADKTSTGIKTVIDHIHLFELNSWEPYKQMYWVLKIMGDTKGAQLAAVGRLVEGAPKNSFDFLINKTISLKQVDKLGGLIEQFKLNQDFVNSKIEYCEVECPSNSFNPFDTSFTFNQKEPSFLTFQNTTCLSWNFGTSFFFNNHLIDEIYENDGLLAQLRDDLPLPEIVQGTVLNLAYPWGGGFFHFMMESLSTIAAAVASEKIHEIDYFYLGSHNEYQIQILSHLGINESKLIFADKRPHINPDKLLVVKDSTPDFPEYEAQYGTCKFIRDSFLPLGNISKLPVSKRVYIGRGPNTNGRSITNEKVLLNHLEKYDFQQIQPEKLSFNDQVKLFSDADVIIAPAGSALLNLLFCKKDTKVLILYPPNCIWRIYWSIASFFELKKFAIFGSKNQTYPISDPDWMVIEDNVSFQVDFSQFKEIIEKMDIDQLQKS